MAHARTLLPLLASLAMVSCGSGEPPAEDVRVVRTMNVAESAAGTDSGYSGEVRARHESTIGFRIAGRVVERRVDAGTRVRAGEVLARLDASDTGLNAASARAQLDSARIEYSQMLADFERAKKLFERRFISQAELDRDEVNLEGSKARVAAAESQYELAANQQAYTLLRAPHDGVVTEIRVEAGEVVSAGQPAAVVAADGAREVVISVPESRLQEMRQAGEASVELWARPGSRYAGHVREIAPMTDGSTRQYTARVAFDEPDATVALGMTARVRFQGSPDAAGGYRLPLTALLQKDGATHIWVVSPETSRVSLREVEVGGILEDSVIVTAGVDASETVVTAGVHLLFEGQKVRVASQGAAGEG